MSPHLMSMRPARSPHLRKTVWLSLPLALAAAGLWLTFAALRPATASPASAASLAEAAPAQLLPAPLAAITLPSFSEARFFGPLNDATYSVAAGDVNGDGALDIVVGNNGEQSVVYLNDGSGHFTSAHNFGGPTDSTYSVALGDLNGDGAPDIIAGNYDRQGRVYLNDGQGNFYSGGVTCSAAPPNVRCLGDGDAIQSVAAADMDGDGDLDIVVGNNGGQSRIYLNNGAANFTPRNFGPVGSRTHSVAVGDLNGDGAPDIIAGNYGEQNAVYLNDGAGNFYTDAVTCAPEPANARCFGAATDKTQSVALADLNGDGALDIVAGKYGQQGRAYLNDGAGRFSAWRDFGLPSNTQSVAVGDVNGDGALDLVVGNTRQPNEVYLNDGNGNFAAGLSFDTGTNQTSSVAAADMDNDGLLDLVTGNSGLPNAVYLNDGSGAFPAAGAYQRPFGGSSTSAVAVADLNGDGAVDIAVGNINAGEADAIYLNDGAGNFADGRSFGGGSDYTRGLAIADLNGDGAPDIVAANYDHPSRVYLNDGRGSFTTGLDFGGDSDPTLSVAVGDLNGDGALDIVAGQDGQPNRLYLNNGAGSFLPAALLDSQAYATAHVALGDLNGDGALDIVAGNDGQPNVIYLNDAAAHFPYTLTLGAATNRTRAVVIGDVNGDGAPDIVTGNDGQPGAVYLNDGHGQFPGAGDYLHYFGTGLDNTRSLALGDINGDGALDLVVGNDNLQQDVAYLNDGAGNFTTARYFGSGTNNTRSVALGDMNGDGALDIVAGNFDQQNTIYLNSPAGGAHLVNNLPRLALTWVQPQLNANFAYSNPALRVRTASIPYRLLDLEGDRANVRAFYSLDGGGSWLPALAAGGTLTQNLPAANAVTCTAASAAPVPLPEARTVTSSLSITAAGVISDVNIWLNLSHNNASQLALTLTAPSNQAIALANRRGGANAFGAAVFDDQAPASIVTATAPYLNKRYRPEQFLARLNGEPALGQWVLAVSNLTSTLTGTLNAWGITLTLNTGAVYTFTWDITGSDVFGQADSTVFRLEALPAHTPGAWSVAGAYQRGQVAAETFPFRVRGRQVRVLDGDSPGGASPVAGALVYRLPAGQTLGGALMADSTGQPFHTDAHGYLQGRGQLFPGDRLFAMAPVSSTESHVLYSTSGAPTATGVGAYTVTPEGLQDLAVSASHPLLLFDLYISLEWDAHNDPTYLDQLDFNLQRASQYLYNFSDGQVALGNVTVFQNADEWAYSHIIIETSNRLRPFAVQGGLVFTPTVDPQHNTVTDTITYEPGQVTIGSIWNRYGNPGQTLSDDWPLILAHELSHYLFFEDDTYLGLDALGYLKPVGDCQGSAMGDLYDKPDNFNFIADAAYWNTHCQDTLAAKSLGRTEWDTLKLWYPALVAPASVFTGPASMPFEFTAVSIQTPYTPTNPLADPTFYIDYANGQISSSGARAYLLRSDKYAINLGSPYGGQNRVLARGAQPGDRLCVFDRALAQFGCENMEIGDDRLQMKADATWNPIIQFTAVDSRTLTLNVSGLPGSLALRARIYPDLGDGEAPIALAQVDGTYSGTLTLTDPVLTGNIQLWVDEEATETNPRREVIVAYSSIGGDPGRVRLSGSQTRLGGGRVRLSGGRVRLSGGRIRLSGGRIRLSGAPLISPDGQMTFFSQQSVDFAEGDFFAIQSMAGLPSLPPGRTLVGQGYSLVASPGVTLPAGSVSIQYLSNDVLLAGANQADLTIYFFNGSSWTALDTVQDAYFNLVTAPSQGSGIYALMASVEIPLYTTGWNLVSYPVQTNRPVSEALRSIDGAYNLVYQYRVTDPADPWKVYAPGVPAWVNDLEQLEYGKVYWINATQTITIHFPTAAAAMIGVAMPPSTFYGTLTPGDDFTPTEGMTLTTWINGVQCGMTQVRRAGAELVYVVDVLADGPGAASCGAAGRTVTFMLNGRQMLMRKTWDSSQIQAYNLLPPFRCFLPITRR